MIIKIKFRAWDYERNEMDYFDLDTYDKYYHNNYGNLMQYTGLKDVNGIEVYSDDIIENCDTHELQIVYWNGDKAAWYCKYMEDIKRIVSLYESLGNLNTVIGNIYQNSELLPA